MRNELLATNSQYKMTEPTPHVFAGVTVAEWFALAAASSVASTATLAIVSPTSQTLATQLQLHQRAMQHAGDCAHLAAFAVSPALTDAALRCALSASVRIAAVPAARALLVDQLTVLCRTANSTGTTDPHLQSEANALLCMCTMSVGRTGAAVKHATQATQACPAIGQGRLWAWKIHASAADGKLDPAETMGRIGSYPGSFQAASWLALAQSSAAEPQQHEALVHSLHAAGVRPELAARYHAEWAEWLINSDSDLCHQRAIQEALHQAIRLLLSVDTSASATTSMAAEGGNDAASSLEARAAERRQDVSAGLGVSELLLLVHTCLLQACVADSKAMRVDWLRSAVHYVERCALCVLNDAFQLQAWSDAQNAALQPELPEKVNDWLEFSPSPDMHTVLNAARASKSVYSISHFTVPQFERALRTLDMLQTKLHRASCAVSCLPVVWLQYLLARQLRGNEEASTYALQAAVLLRDVGCHAASSQCITAAGACRS